MENINFLDAQAGHQLPQENGYPQRQQHPMQPQHPMEQLGQTQALPHANPMPPLVHTSVAQPTLTAQQQPMYRVSNVQNTLPPAFNGAPNALPGFQQPTPGRCLGLEYANMKKEKAREEYKENRKMQLLAMGEGSRIKRRKKNDTSMTENEKYHRRLKMNQDSAAAARHAQDVYVGTLEKLVETTEAEKSFLQYQNRSLLEEREGLFRTIQELRHQVNVANARAPRADGSLVDESSEQATAGDDPNAQSQVILKKMWELMGGLQDERPENAMQGAKKHVTEAA